MELTLKRLLEHAEFKKYRGKGYDPAEVDDFLDRAAAMASKVEVQLTQALADAKAGGAGATSPVTDEEIERRVAERVATELAQAPARPEEAEVAQEAQRTLVLAQRTADAAVREAREDADKLLAAAKEEADALLADAGARSESINRECDETAAAAAATVEAEVAAERRVARQRLAAEIGELEGTREGLRSDVSILERHVEEQRSQLGSTLAELQQILDDPSGFRMAPTPALTDPAIPDFSDLDHEDQPDEVPVDTPEVEVEVEAEVEVDVEAEVEVEADSEPDPEPNIEVESGVIESISEVDHEAPGIEEPQDGGPPTAAVSAVELGVEEAEDPFLAELRKAMSDDDPLGPRDHEELPQTDALFEGDDRRGWRFGRR